MEPNPIILRGLDSSRTNSLAIAAVSFLLLLPFLSVASSAPPASVAHHLAIESPPASLDTGGPVPRSMTVPGNAPASDLPIGVGAASGLLGERSSAITFSGSSGPALSAPSLGGNPATPPHSARAGHLFTYPRTNQSTELLGESPSGAWTHVGAPSGSPAATVSDTLVIANQTLSPGNVVPENGDYPSGVALDAKDGKLFMATWGGALIVINTSSERVVDAISVGTGMAAVAYDGRNGEVYVTHGSLGNFVSVINATSDKVARIIGVGSWPTGVTVDPATGRVYVINDASNNVTVISGATNRVTASFPAGQGPQFLAVDSANGELFITNYGGSNVTIVSGTTYQSLGSVTTGLDPGGITYDPANGYLYVADEVPLSPSTAGEVTVIDGATGNVVTTISIQFARASYVGVCPWGVAYDNASKQVYVTDSTCTNAGYVTVIDSTSNTVRSTIPVGEEPNAIVYDGSSGLLYVANEYSLNATILNGSLQRVVGSVGAGELPNDLVYDPVNRLAYVADQGGNDVAILNGSSGAEIGNITSQYGPDGLALDATNGYLYVANSQSQNVSVVDTSTQKIIGSIPVGKNPQGLAYDPANGDIYVANCDSRNVSIINGATERVIRSVAAEICPRAILYVPENGRLLVTNSGPPGAIEGVDENVTVIDGTTNQVVGSIPVGGVPWGAAYDNSDGVIYVANAFSGNLTVINGTTDRVIGAIPLGPLWGGSSPVGLVYDPLNDELIATFGLYYTADQVVAVSPSTGHVLGEAVVGLVPGGIALNLADGELLVANWLSGTVSILQPTVYPLTRFTVTFDESGLSTGTPWAVALNGSTNGSSLPSVGFSVTEGHYSFTIAPVDGYVLLSLSNGSVNVHDGNLSVPIRFSQLFAVTFSERGLFVGTSWSLVWNGTTIVSASLTVVVNATNGDYRFTVPPAGGFVPSPANGTVSVSGNNVSESIRFEAPPPAPPSIQTFTVNPQRVQLGLTVTILVRVAGGTPPLGYAYFGLPTGCRSGNSTELFCMPSGAGNYTVEVVVTDAIERSAAANASLQVYALGSEPPPGTSIPTLFGLPVAEGYGLLAAGVTALAVAVLAMWRSRQRPLRKRVRVEGRGSRSSQEQSMRPPR